MVPVLRGARWLDRLSGLSLTVATSVALGAAGPSLLRAAGVPLPTTDATEPDGAVPSLDLAHQPPEILAHPDDLFDPDRDSDGDEVELPWADEPDPGAGRAMLGRALGSARVPLSLRDQPADGGRLVGQVKTGELMMIEREAGDWMLVWYSGDGALLRGWAKKSGIAVR
jgi:hypothetical protein